MMHRIDRRRRLAVMAVFLAAFLSQPLLLPAQPRSRQAKGASHAPAAPAQKVVPAPAIDATPEQIGDALLARQHYQQAIAEYNQVPRKSAGVWNKIGIAYQQMFDERDAMRCYKQSLRLNPRDAQVVNNLGTVYDSLKDYRKAQHYYRKSLKLNPDSALVAKNLGTSLLARRKYAQGWDMYEQALALNPHVFDEQGASIVENPATIAERGAMNYYMAKGCVQAGLTDRAISYLRLALSEGFTNPKKIAEDSSFARLRGIPAFQQLMVEQRSQ